MTCIIFVGHYLENNYLVESFHWDTESHFLVQIWRKFAGTPTPTWVGQLPRWTPPPLLASSVSCDAVPLRNAFHQISRPIYSDPKHLSSGLHVWVLLPFISRASKCFLFSQNPCPREGHDNTPLATWPIDCQCFCFMQRRTTHLLSLNRMCLM